MFSIPPPFDFSASATWAALFLSRTSHSWANKERGREGEGERVRSFEGKRNTPCAAACSDAHIVSHLSLSLSLFLPILLFLRSCPLSPSLSSSSRLPAGFALLYALDTAATQAAPALIANFVCIEVGLDA